MKINAFFLTCCLICLSGCASGFEQNYQPEERYAPGVNIQTCMTPRVEKMSPYEHFDDVNARMQAKGYILMGRSEWESTFDENKDTAFEQGQKVGACVVLWRRVDAGTVHSTRTVSHFIPATTTTVTVAGKYGPETRTVEVPGRTESREEPVTYQRYDFLGLFFGKAQSASTEYDAATGDNTKARHGLYALGIEGIPPHHTYMARHDSRRGILVTSVIPNSPAYHANIFPDDIILQLNGSNITYNSTFALHLDRENSLLIERNNTRLLRKVYVPHSKM